MNDVAENSAGLDAPAVAARLAELGRRLALTEASPYRARAYVRAAESLRALPEPLETYIRAGRLTAIPGIGDALAAVITRLHETGTHPTLEKLRELVPAGVLDMLAIPGLRPDKVLLLYK
ncbi:MAG: DNA polymerase/3'-5' exonuclease PolX, partial [Alphaproteobacteria bacterium]|nr:DNA polymerase/3'-5' exonuclease PolX [Alphaproteobacteria bacterium]